MIIFLFFLVWIVTFTHLTFLSGLSYLFAFLWFFVGLAAGYVAVFLTMILTVPFVIYAKSTNRLKHFYLRHLCDFVRLFIIKLKIDKVIGFENIPKDSAYGIYANHRSGADALIMLSLTRKRIGMLAKDSLFINKFVTRWLNGFGILSLDRDNARNALKEINRGSKLMSEGLPMAVFPEGTRKKEDFHNLDTFKPGAFKLTTKAKLPILPVALIGSEDYHKRYLRRTTNVKVIIGKPIEYDDYKDLNAQELSDKVAGKIMKMLKEHETIH